MAPYLMVLIRTNKIIFVVFKNQSSNITFLALGKGQIIFMFERSGCSIIFMALSLYPFSSLVLSF